MGRLAVAQAFIIRFWRLMYGVIFWMAMAMVVFDGSWYGMLGYLIIDMDWLDLGIYSGIYSREGRVLLGIYLGWMY